MKITNIFQSFSTLFTYFGYFRKGMRIKSDWTKFTAEWNRIGGFQASTKQLLDLLNDFSLLFVEYATWTPTDLDDQIVRILRSILADHRDILERMINRVRVGEEIFAPELSAMVETVGTADTYGSPMTILYILSVIYRVLQFLKLRDTDNESPEPDKVPPMPTHAPKRPLINRIRTIFERRQKLAGVV